MSELGYSIRMATILQSDNMVRRTVMRKVFRIDFEEVWEFFPPPRVVNNWKFRRGQHQIGHIHLLL